MQILNNVSQKKKDGKNVYFLTEFLGGGDLFTAIREIGNLSKRQAQRLGEIGPGWWGRPAGVDWLDTNYPLVN